MYNKDKNNPYCVPNTVISDGIKIIIFPEEISIYDNFDNEIENEMIFIPNYDDLIDKIIKLLENGSVLSSMWFSPELAFHDSGIITYEYVQTIYQDYNVTDETVNSFIDHQILIEGYYPEGALNDIDDSLSTPSPPVWKIRNSHGENWGYNGYFYIEAGKNLLGCESIILQTINTRYRTYEEYGCTTPSIDESGSNIGEIEPRPWGCGGISNLCSNLWDNTKVQYSNLNEQSFKEGCSLLINKCRKNNDDFCSNNVSLCNTDNVSFNLGCNKGRLYGCEMNNLCDNIGYNAFKKQEQETIDFLNT